MQFTRIKLSNWRCFADTDVSLGGGVIVFHGPNGSGKSSLLDAAFFALYGSDALQDNIQLENVVTKQQELATIELWFIHAGHEFYIERHIKDKGERQTNSKSVIKRDGEIVADGATDVTEYVSDMLHMDAESFVNCVYVRQGDVAKLIHASPKERQDIIDELLQLGELEEWRERASKARVGVKRVRNEVQSERDTLDGQIEEKEAEGYEGQLATVTEKIERVDDEIAEWQSKIDKAEARMEDATEVIEEADELRDEAEELQQKIDSLTEKISDKEATRDDLVDKLDALDAKIESLTTAAEDATERVNAVSGLDELLVDGEYDTTPLDTEVEAVEAEIDTKRDTISDLRVSVSDTEGKAERTETEAENLEAQAEDKRAQADTLTDTIDSVTEKIGAKREEIEAERERVADAEGKFEAVFPDGEGDAEEYYENMERQLDDVQERIESCQSELSALTDRIERAEELKAEGKCPECGQPIEGSPHVKNLDTEREERDELQEKLDSLKAEREEYNENLAIAEELLEAERTMDDATQNIDRLESEVEEWETRREDNKAEQESLREEASELEEEAAEKREEAESLYADAETVEDTLSAENDELDALTARRDLLTDAADAVSELVDARSQRETAKTQKEQAEELRTEWESQRADLEAEYEEVSEAIDTERLDEARQTLADAKQNLTTAEEEQGSLEETRDELQARKGNLEGAIEDLEALRDAREAADKNAERLEAHYKELESIEQMYGDLRAQLRQQNLSILRRLLNDIFDELYENDAYSNIELTNEYELTVHEKSGAGLEPKELSGGEKVIFNLALRVAIYKLLTQGIDSSGGMPPLIMDEPTANLDKNHVGRIQNIVQLMRDLGVDQTFVVSHNSQIVDSADQEVELSQNSTTNRSTATRAGGLSI